MIQLRLQKQDEPALQEKYHLAMLEKQPLHFSVNE